MLGDEGISLIWPDLEENQIGVVLVKSSEDTATYSEGRCAVPRALFNSGERNRQRPHGLELDHHDEGRTPLISDAPNIE